MNWHSEQQGKARNTYPTTGSGSSHSQQQLQSSRARQDKSQRTLLHLAIAQTQYDIVELLMSFDDPEPVVGYEDVRKMYIVLEEENRSKNLPRLKQRYGVERSG
jgi:ankyrin repeat protein